MIVTVRVLEHDVISRGAHDLVFRWNCLLLHLHPEVRDGASTASALPYGRLTRRKR